MIFFMAGTSDARALALSIQAKGYPLLASVVTDHAAEILEHAGIRARSGRLNLDSMCQLLDEIGATALVDASHPFAEEAHRTAMAAADARGIPYIRFERATQEFGDSELVTYVDTYEQAADYALSRKGSIMLTTGSKTLQIFTERLLGRDDIRLVARMLPRVDNMEKCAKLRLEQRNIIAMQGPFSRELNEALYRHYETTLMVTKESGGPGAVDDKVAAALAMGIEVVVIGRPKLAYGTSFSTEVGVLAELERITHRS
ncbi:precorrin-6A reductase [Alicyclobacillus fastidiosus]|uniref:Precorrin-6A reductase n=1 Tax=Alicyclobacillus fastidiosus TaxID=392011 RepID=A0ABY6ZFW0_9BACL|nr:precorrin-6A reductase [Alicyclobacillus fastidiosus]WAH41747.1 precorrin-6A reductase [Alicyclobacillus fastidiosus]GMA63438.1 precorrin-6A reductase [Alicyclobacillus fastidiosus]